MGLTIAKSLAQMMDGDILVESEYGKGSVFTVTFMQKPVQGQIKGTVPAEKYLVEQTDSIDYSGTKVLLVDDNHINLKIAAVLLESFGVEIDCVTSGQEALLAVQKQEYHLIFMAHMMPEMMVFKR